MSFIINCCRCFCKIKTILCILWTLESCNRLVFCQSNAVISAGIQYSGIGFCWFLLSFGIHLPEKRVVNIAQNQTGFQFDLLQYCNFVGFFTKEPAGIRPVNGG